MSTFLRAPYPTTKVVSVLPDPQQQDSRGSQSKVQILRGATNVNKWTYVQSSNKVNISVTWILTRAKDEELTEFIRIYHTAEWELEYTHEEIKGVAQVKKWRVKLVGRPIRRTTTSRQDENNTQTGDEAVEVTLEFSAEAI
jgi:hypothetical protein